MKLPTQAAVHQDASPEAGGAMAILRQEAIILAGPTTEGQNSPEEGLLMIVARNVFQLKFGKAREALAVMKEGLAIQKRLGSDASYRLLTDLTGPHYTLILEVTVPNLAAMEATLPRVFGDKDFQANYQKLVPLVESGHREVYTIVDID